MRFTVFLKTYTREESWVHTGMRLVPEPVQDWGQISESVSYALPCFEKRTQGRKVGYMFVYMTIYYKHIHDYAHTGGNPVCI